MIRHKSHHRPTRLRANCTRTPTAFLCRPTFSIGGKNYTGVFLVWYYVQNGKTYWTGFFNGHRGHVSVHWRI
jgi:hypothetical protein